MGLVSKSALIGNINDRTICLLEHRHGSLDSTPLNKNPNRLARAGFEHAPEVGGA